MNKRRSLVALIAICALLSSVKLASARSPYVIGTPVRDPRGSIAAAAVEATAGWRWYGLDGHVHTDHSHDAGFFHQQDKRPENHDTFVADQLAQAALMGESMGVLTDHRTYDQAYDPDYRSDAMTLVDGEEWGGYPHATAWGISEVLEQGNDEGVCGVARAAPEVHAQDGIFGIAHPEDGRRPCISTDTLKDVPIDHLEAFRSPHTNFWEANLQAGRRFVPATGSDNHFKQLYGTEAGTGGNSTMVFATAPTQAAMFQSIREGRVVATTRVINPTITTLLDADGDGSFDASTGRWAVPPAGATTVRVAFQISLGSGYWLQVVDDTGAIVAQEPVALADQTFAYDLPATSKYYHGQLATEPVQRFSGGTIEGNLAYEDTLKVLSAPVYLSAPAPLENGTQAVASGTLRKLSSAPWAGFAKVAHSGDNAVVVWQQRNVPVYEIALSRSTDGGATWSAPVVLSSASEDARTPAVAIDGDHALVAWERHDGHAHGGVLETVTSNDGGATFGAPESVPSPGTAARPAVAVAGSREHVAWMSMEDGYKIRTAARDGGAWPASPQKLSSAVEHDGPPLSWVVPPKPIRHVPAAVHPAIAVDGDRVAVAWEDDREDPTPLRRGTPDDWGIYASFSNDGGATWSADRRITARHDRVAGSDTDPEKLEGNPQRHADLMFDGGTLYLAYQDRYPADGATAFVTSSRDNGLTWSSPVAVSTPNGEYAYKPKLSVAGGTLQVVWQQSAGRRWTLRSAASSDGGATFSPGEAFTTGSGYAGYPGAAGSIVTWTGEEGGVYGVYVRA